MRSLDEIQERLAKTAHDVRDRIDEARESLVETVREAKDRVLGVTHKVRDKVDDKIDEATVAGARIREAVQGEPDALGLLKKDHELVNGIFDQLDAIKGRQSDLREGLFAQLKYELGTHAAIEERLFYPEVRKAATGREKVMEAFQEHRIMKQLLAELAAMPLGGVEWDAKLTKLREDVQHHVQEEERDLFKLAHEVLDEKQLMALGRRLEQEKQMLARAGRPDESDDAAALAGKAPAEGGGGASGGQGATGERRGAFASGRPGGTTGDRHGPSR